MKMLNQYLFSPSPSPSTHVFSPRQLPSTGTLVSHSAVVLCILLKHGVQPWRRAPGYGPNCCKCGWRFSWTTEHPIQNCVNLLRGEVTAQHFTTAWVMRQKAQSSVYSLKQKVDLNPGTAQAELPVPTKEWKKMKTATGDFPGGPAAKSPQPQCRGSWVQLLVKGRSTCCH